MFSPLSRWLVVCSVLFCISGNTSANAVSVSDLIGNGYRIVSSSSAGGALKMNLLLQKRDKLFVCYIHGSATRCMAVIK